MPGPQNEWQSDAQEAFEALQAHISHANDNLQDTLSSMTKAVNRENDLSEVRKLLVEHPERNLDVGVAESLAEVFGFADNAGHGLKAKAMYLAAAEALRWARYYSELTPDKE